MWITARIECAQFRMACLALLLLVVSACSSKPSSEEWEAERQRLDEICDRTLKELVDSNPELESALESSPGFAIVKMNVAKAPAVGAGTGYGVVVDHRTGKRSYVKVSRFDLGGGLGVQKLRIMVLFEEEAPLDQALAGQWHVEAGGEATAGEAGASGNVSAGDDGYRVYRIHEGGAAATVTVHAIRATPYLE